MSSLTTDVIVNGQDLFTQVSNAAGTVPYNTSNPQVGVRAVTGDGREFRFQQAGAVNLASGVLLQSPANTANLVNVTGSTNAIGATSFTYTISSTSITAGSLVGGMFYVNAGTGAGQTLKIASHSSGTVTSLTVVTEDALTVATSVSDSKFSILKNPYSASIINPTTPTGGPIGVSIIPVTASYYAWIQVKGNVACLNDSSTTIGLAVAPSQATAGAVKTGATTLNSIGFAPVAGVTTEYNLINLLLN